MPKPLPHPLVSFFAGALADAFVHEIEAKIRAGTLDDDDQLFGMPALASSIRDLMKENPGGLVALGQDLSPEAWAAVDAFVATLHAKGEGPDDAVSGRFAREAIKLSRERFFAAVAGALLQSGGFRVDD